MSHQPKLISFKLCPFVQRSVIALLEKQVDFDMTHIQLDDPPEWFKQVSPLGKVPVLMVGDTPVFESAVILEYLDEVYSPQLHPNDPLTKALHRSWIEYCSELIMTQYKMFTADTEEQYNEHKQNLENSFNRLIDVVDKTGPFFSGDKLSLIDATYAPLFMRLALVKKECSVELNLDQRLQAWSDALLALDSVKNSVVEDFDELFMGFMGRQGGFLFS